MCDLSSETIGEDFSKLLKKEPGAIRAFFCSDRSLQLLCSVGGRSYPPSVLVLSKAKRPWSSEVTRTVAAPELKIYRPSTRA